MAAMRIFKSEEVERHLRDLGCEKIDEYDNPGLVDYWKGPDGPVFTIPRPDELSGGYSDWMIYEILESVGLPGAPWGGED